MATTAPDPRKPRHRAGSTRSSPTGGRAPAAPIEDREPATGRPLMTLRGSTPDDVARAAAAAAGRPAGVGGDELPGARARSSAAPPRSTRPIAPSSGPGPSARPARPQQDAPRAELRRPARSSNAATMPFAAVRLARADRRARAGCRWSAGSRSGSSARSRRGTRRGARACASSPRRSRSATPSSSSPIRRRRSVGGAIFAAVFREAGLPEGLLQVVIGGADVGEAIVTDPNVNRRLVHRLDGRRAARRGARRRAAQEGLASSSAATTRSSCSTTPTSRRPPSAGAFSSFQFQGQVCFATGRHIVHRERRRRRTSTCSTEKAEAPAPRRPVPRGRGARPDRQREAARARRRDRPALGRRAAPASSSAARTTACSTARRCSPTSRPDRRRGRDEIFGPVAPVVGVRHRRGGARARQRQRVRPGRRGLLALDLARPGARPPHPRGHGPRQRPDRQRRGDHPVRRDGRVRQRRRYGGAANCDDVHRVAVGHRPRRARRTRPATEPRRGIDHRGRAARRRLDGDRVARRLGGRLPGPRGDAGARPRGGPRRSTTSPTRWPAACSRATSRSSASSSTTSPTRTSRRSSAASRTRRRPAATSSSPAARSAIAEREHSYVRLLRSMRAAAVDLRRQRPRRPGRQRGDAPPRRGDARLRRRGRPPLAARRRRAGGRRRQRGGHRVDGRGAGRPGPPADRVPGRAGVAVRRARAAGRLPPRPGRARASRSTSGSSSSTGLRPEGGALGDRHAARRRGARSPRSAAPTTCSRSAPCSGSPSSASTSRARSRSPASTTSRSRR